MMRILLLNAVILVAIVVFSGMFAHSLAGENGIEFQLHDSYFVVTELDMMLLAIGPSMVVVYLFMGIFLRFRSISTNIALMAGLILHFSVVNYAVLLFSAVHPINDPLMWAMNVIGLTCVIILTIRTIKLWRPNPQAI